ncbi:MAG: PadR family transcriptional regulator [Acidobacteria bacterium]|nr:MAG: PadR family transcriptional regulator [Acidobacteriota bacterium]
MSRFIEPDILLLLKKKGCSYGYDLGNELQRHAISDAEIDPGALYRTLRTLEANGNVVSEWGSESSGPARRVYRLTKTGEAHLREWAAVLDHLSESLQRFVSEASAELGVDPGAVNK